MFCSTCTPSPQSVTSANISEPVYQGFAIDLLDAISKVRSIVKIMHLHIEIFICRLRVFATSKATSCFDDILYKTCDSSSVFRLYLVPDNLYGVYDHTTREWNGIVRLAPDLDNFKWEPWQIDQLAQFIDRVEQRLRKIQKKRINNSINIS